MSANLLSRQITPSEILFFKFLLSIVGATLAIGCTFEIYEATEITPKSEPKALWISLAALTGAIGAYLGFRLALIADEDASSTTQTNTTSRRFPCCFQTHKQEPSRLIEDNVYIALED